MNEQEIITAQIIAIETYKDVIEADKDLFEFWLEMGRLSYWDFKEECLGLGIPLTEELIEETFKTAYFGMRLLEQNKGNS
ncbi:hypothetical protein L4D00_15060 [Photobacterium swingsii]|uniref:hypothetical protein n=1 Tax=Photobacterium swingsii TaxID=680026 RepID=UPI003D0A8F65